MSNSERLLVVRAVPRTVRSMLLALKTEALRVASACARGPIPEITARFGARLIGTQLPRAGMMEAARGSFIGEFGISVTRVATCACT